MGGRRGLLEGWVSRSRQMATHKQGQKADREDIPLPGTLATGCPGLAWGNLALLCSYCERHWEPQRVWGALVSQQELTAAPVGPGGVSGSLEDRQ